MKMNQREYDLYLKYKMHEITYNEWYREVKKLSNQTKGGKKDVRL